MTHNPASLFADLASPAVACLSAKHAPPALWVPRSRLAMAELVFNVAFSVEVVLRFIADGGIRNYFREAWNVFDFLMVMAGYSSLLPVGNSNTGAIRALRALRALRPLRTITRFQSLRVIVVAFLESVPMIGQVTMLMFFVMVLFGISALSLFSGAFHYECYDPVTGQPETYPNPILPDEFGCGGWRTCPPAFPVCRHSSANLAINAAGFDNLATSLLTVFQIMTLGDACIVMYRVIDNTSWASALWFVALILFMTHLSLNLFLAVLKLEFGRAQRAFAEELKATRKSTKKTTFAKAINFVRAGMHNFVDRQRAKVRGADWHVLRGATSGDLLRVAWRCHRRPTAWPADAVTYLRFCSCSAEPGPPGGRQRGVRGLGHIRAASEEADGGAARGHPASGAGGARERGAARGRAGLAAAAAASHAAFGQHGLQQLLPVRHPRQHRLHGIRVLRHVRDLHGRAQR